MKKEHLVNFINEGKKFGIQLSNVESDIVGWLAVGKAFVNQRLLDLHADEQDSKEYKLQKLIMEKPFYIRVAELPRNVYDGDSFPSNEDYRRNDVYRFYNIYEVEEFLQTLGYELTDLKWYREIEHD